MFNFPHNNHYFNTFWYLCGVYDSVIGNIHFVCYVTCGIMIEDIDTVDVMWSWLLGINTIKYAAIFFCTGFTSNFSRSDIRR